MNKLFFILLVIGFISCKKKADTIKPSIAIITESVYASGLVKTQNQYQVYPSVNGILKEILVNEGATVQKGTPLFTIKSDIQQLNKENAVINEQYNSLMNNQEKLNEAQISIDLAKAKLKIDSNLLIRQRNLWQQEIGSKNDLDQRELNFQSSLTAYKNAQLKYLELKKQLQFIENQSLKNSQIAKAQLTDFIIKSEIDGTVFSTLKEKGEAVTTQTPLAIIGNNSTIILEMQVDELDIFKIKIGQQVLVTMDSYKGKVFEAKVSNIKSIINNKTKTSVVEATFVNAPETLYPNISFEANIILQTKKNALLIPRSYLVNDSLVLNKSNEKITIKTGLKDYQMVEVLSGLTLNDVITKPK
jgi:multidrug efflux pump subunit AcrA (membrane-fusion protein)